MVIVVRQGHSRFSIENEFLGEFRVGNLDLRADGIAEIDISFRLDGNGMLHVAAKDVVSGRTVEMKMRNYGEFIREDEDFDSSVTQEKAQIGVGDSSASRGSRGLDVQIQHKQLAPSVDDKTQQVAKRMRDLMAVVEFDDTEEPTVLDGEVIENVFGSVDDEPENLEISLGDRRFLWEQQSLRKWKTLPLLESGCRTNRRRTD